MTCPFKAGDWVVYEPDDRSYGLEVMSSPPSRLERGRSYRVTVIEKGAYLVVEGHPHPGGGLHYSSFRLAAGRAANPSS